MDMEEVERVEEVEAREAVEQVQAYWDQQAADFDRFHDHGLADHDARRAWKDLLRTWLPTTPGDVVDLACGTGTLSVLAAELGHTVRGIDLSGEMVARAHAKTAPFGAAVEITQGDASDPPLEPGSADVVLARHILWALPDPVDALRRWARLLRPGGRMVLIEGRWGSEARGSETPRPGAAEGGPADRPWGAGVTSEQLSQAVASVVGSVVVIQLSDEIYWGKPIEHERYLLTATRPGL